MTWIPGARFRMGSDHHYPEEAPSHWVAVDGFWMDACAVTNREFAQFVAETGHVTLAERAARAEDYPGARPELLQPSSVVFRAPRSPVDLRDPCAWWTYVPGADWRHPQGPDSSIDERMEHPVVHVAYEDVETYARWIGKALPTEAEWELAARGGLDGAEYVWGDELTPAGTCMANTWQGEFPRENLVLDGFAGTAPVASFPPNGYGLHDMAGNVWEWCQDWYEAHRMWPGCCTVRDPQGGNRKLSADPRAPGEIPRKVMKGGSYLCAANYCRRYRPAARMAQPIDTSTCHLGFRCIVRAVR
jgi:formylglycine-generating enzyme required for sulfatase activity